MATSFRFEKEDSWDNCECPPEKCDHGMFVSLPGETYTSLAQAGVRRGLEPPDVGRTSEPEVEIRRTTESPPVEVRRPPPCDCYLTGLQRTQDCLCPAPVEVRRASECPCSTQPGVKRTSECECPDLSDLGNEDDCSCPDDSLFGASGQANEVTTCDNCECQPRSHRVMPDFDKLRFVSDNPKTRTYQMLEMKRCHDKNIQNRFPTLLTNQFQLLGRKEYPVEDPPYAAWEIRHRRNPELLETPRLDGITLPYENALPTFMYVPIANFGTRVAGALFDVNADHRIKKTALRAMND